MDERANVAVFIGHSEVSKAYRAYNLKRKSVVVARDVKFDEEATWDWEKSEVVFSSSSSSNQQTENDAIEYIDENAENIDHLPVRGLRSLDEVYERCNMAFVEPSNYFEAAEHEEWKQAMLEEMKMILGCWLIDQDTRSLVSNWCLGSN